MYFFVSLVMTLEVLEFSHKILSFLPFSSFEELFSSILELNCCGRTVVCESNKHRLSIHPTCEVLNGPIEDNTEQQRTRGL